MIWRHLTKNLEKADELLVEWLLREVNAAYVIKV